MDNQFELPKEGVRIYNPDSGWQTGPSAPVTSPVDPTAGAPGLSSDTPTADHPTLDMEDDRAPREDPADQTKEYPTEYAKDKEYAEGKSPAVEADAPLQQGAALSNSQTETSGDVQDLSAPAVSTPMMGGTGFRSRRNSNSERVYTARSEPFVSSASTGAAQTVKPYPRPPAIPQETSDIDEAANPLVPQTQAAALARVGDSLDSLFTVIQRATVHQVVDGNAPSWRDVANISRHLEDRLNTRQHLLKELHAVDQEIRETRQDLLLTLNALSEYEQQNLQAASMRASISAVAAKVIAKRFAESSGD